MSSTLEDAISARTHAHPIRWWLSRQTFWVSIAVAIACVALTLATDTFATERNLFNVTRNFAFVGIIALGMTVVIITRGIDLSVGSSVVLSAIITGLVMAAGYPLWLAALLAIAGALAVGLVNGAADRRVAGMPPFVITLGTLSIVRSLAMVLSGNKMIYEFGPGSAAAAVARRRLDLGVPNPVVVLVVLALILGFMLRWSQWGAPRVRDRRQRAGGDPDRRTGDPDQDLGLHGLGIAAGVTGVLEVGWLGGVTTNLGQGMELTVIAAAVIGGANLAGGTGTAFGAVVGAALIEVIRNSLILLGISTFWQGTFVGSFIVLAVAVDRLRTN